MAQPIEITSTKQFQTLLSTTSYVIVDFHATWCGPCHAIAPIYAQLAKAHGKENSVAFVKVDVDAQPEIAAEYEISAMPTFLVIKEGKVLKDQSVRGGNPPALKQAVAAAVAGAKAIAEKKAEAEEKKAESEPKSEETVSGSYSVSKGEGWKTSLH